MAAVTRCIPAENMMGEFRGGLWDQKNSLKLRSGGTLRCWPARFWVRLPTEVGFLLAHCPGTAPKRRRAGSGGQDAQHSKFVPREVSVALRGILLEDLAKTLPGCISGRRAKIRDTLRMPKNAEHANISAHVLPNIEQPPKGTRGFLKADSQMH